MDFKTAFQTGGTTKKNHGYYSFYDEMLSDIEVDSVLEIGVYLGQSLYAWRMMWPEAIIEAVDKDCRYDDSLDDRFAIFQGDSTRAVPEGVRTEGYDIVIDDGDHHWSSQIKTFNNFKHLAKKFYIIEDICGRYAEFKIYENLPQEIIDRSTLFEAYGPTRYFKHSDYSEPGGQYRVLFIDMRS
jgi:hypothetical protein